ncbi:MAG TPA: TauD/TfdA family dioxygenase [Mycobacteriales bacterium]|nr:TauD/TfdA family dioxygenase [Mycobacteriales bacterium]
MAREITVDGHRYAAIWLRDNCRCAQCLTPSGQKLFGILDLPADVQVSRESVDGDILDLTFAPDGHRSRFELSWLAAHCTEGRPPFDDRAEDAKTLWGSTAELGVLPEVSWDDYTAASRVRAHCLASLQSVGLFLLHGVPVVEGAVRTVAETFGFVRTTNYGEIFDVRVEPAAANLAYSSLPIAPHTDNPYRDPVPTVQLLHCLTNDAVGGDSGLLDGFAAASALREASPAAFEVLSSTPVTFRYADGTASLSATHPMIGVDPLGRITQIRFNNRSLCPVTLDRAALAEFYAAYRRFAELLARPEAQLAIRLAPGDCLVFDNTRVLHARTGFSESGRRHLQGCYADLDAAFSQLAVLRA